ncbi:MAG: hypothetical protein R3202_09395, partial [Candidatus Competibacterales bacterium]|nr:hypothetical protein [Candidatus Competibacterales bacterium]
MMLLETLTIVAALATGQVAKHEFPLPDGITGSWYDLERPGEGWIVEMLDDDRVLVAWFTYPPAGSDHDQAWLLGTGTVLNDVITIDRLQTFSGPRFGPGFDPDALEAVDWGSIILAYETCNLGELAYEGPMAWGSELRVIDRLTDIVDVPCTGEAPPAGASIGLTGAWFDPDQVGAGLFFEELADGRLNAYWFTYDDQGQPAWMTGVGERAENEFVFETMFMPRGTRFGADFDPAAVVLEPWGRMVVSVPDCTGLDLDYESTVPGFGEGSLALVRLTEPRGVDCVAPLALTGGNWIEVAPPPTPRSELSVAVLDGIAYVSGGFGGPRRMESYDPERDAWTAHADMPVGRNHHMSAAYEGEIYVFGGYADSSFTGTRSAIAFDPANDSYRTLADLPVNHAAAGQAVVVGDRIYLAGGVQRAIQVYDPATDGWELITVPGEPIRDHSTAVLFDGEIWILAGRSNVQGAFSTVSIFNPESRTYRAGPRMVEPHSGYAAAVVQGQIMAVGGELNTGANAGSPVSIDTLEIYVPTEQRWRRAPDLPIALHGIGGVALQGR